MAFPCPNAASTLTSVAAEFMADFIVIEIDQWAPAPFTASATECMIEAQPRKVLNQIT
jgi:hypothetical protein